MSSTCIVTSCDLKMASDRVVSVKFEFSALDYGFSEVIAAWKLLEELFLASGGGALPPLKIDY